MIFNISLGFGLGFSFEYGVFKNENDKYFYVQLSFVFIQFSILNKNLFNLSYRLGSSIKNLIIVADPDYLNNICRKTIEKTIMSIEGYSDFNHNMRCKLAEKNKDYENEIKIKNNKINELEQTILTMMNIKNEHER